ncbi:glycerophosphodiester phosphodiesterase [Streptomyces sp. NPDC051546]|uniref:glycerophosphodiester phosphodiesterase n=1 Tax=Streptomyces sp. NPDC051546 TaxID=3365655 RepID=UPI0037ACD407
MARNLFGGTAADVAEDTAGVRVPGISGTIWDGPAEGAAQVTDLIQPDGTPIAEIISDEYGMLPPFYGPEQSPERLYIDFGSGIRTAILSSDVGERFASHLTAPDPHGTQAALLAEINGRVGTPGGLVPLGTDGLVPPQFIPASGPPTATVAAFLAMPAPAYIAHRGSGMEYPEHTMAAYDAALTSGVRAIEVSVNTTAEGIPVCIHDQNLDRTTNATGPVSDWVYPSLINGVMVQPKQILGNGWAPQPLPNLRDVLDRFLGKVVIFLEPKSNEAAPIVQNILQTYYPTANQSVVWKAYYKSPTFPTMKSRGFATWGYVDDATTDADLTTYGASIDIWGVPHTMAPTRIQEIVNRPDKKKVICWEVHRRSQRDTLAGLGVWGMMCAQYKWVSHTKQILKRDNWVTQVKAPGDMGRTQYVGTRDLKYDGTGWAFMDIAGDAVLIGSCSIPEFPANGYRITFEMKYDGTVPTNEHAGIAFGKADDSTYQFGAPNPAGGYHMAFRGNGDMQIFSHTAGVTNGTQLATAATAAPVAGQVMSFQVDVTPANVKITRTDVTPNVSVTSANQTYRGGYIHVSGGSVSNLANRPRWRKLTVNAL